MELRTEVTSDGIKVITLSGRMDIAGTNLIHESFATAVGAEKALVVVDLSDVAFLASIGMRTLVYGARALLAVGGAMALANPQRSVREALASTGVDSLTPVYPGVDSARLALLALHR